MGQQKDIISKDLLKRLADSMAKILLKLEFDEIEVVETQMQRVEERRADLIAKVTTGNESYLLHIEIQNGNESAMPWRMLRYRTDIYFTYPKLQVRQTLFYIGKKRLTMPKGIEENGLNFCYQVIDMHDIPCDELLKQDTPEALVLAILTDFGTHSEHEVVRHILQRLELLTAEHENMFRDYFLMLEILSQNRDLEQVIKQEQDMLSQVRYSDLPSYHLGMEKGKLAGMEQGIEKGEIKLFLRMVESRFGSLPDDLLTQVNNANSEQLESWSLRLFTVTSLGELFLTDE